MRIKKVFTVFLCVMFIYTMIPIYAGVDIEKAENESIIIQPKFMNIAVFYNEFYVTDEGKAVLVSSIDARNVDECKIDMYLQKYQNGRWTTVKYWSTTESGLFCGLGEVWYLTSGYHYRMVSYGYVYMNGTLLESTYFVSLSTIY